MTATRIQGGRFFAHRALLRASHNPSQKEDALCSTLAIAVRNIADPGTTGHALPLTLTFRNLPPNAAFTVERVDDDHGNVLPRYAAMGSPLDPTEVQVATLNRQTALAALVPVHLTQGMLTLALGPNTLVLLQTASPIPSIRPRPSSVP